MIVYGKPVRCSYWDMETKFWEGKRVFATNKTSYESLHLRDANNPNITHAVFAFIFSQFKRTPEWNSMVDRPDGFICGYYE